MSTDLRHVVVAGDIVYFRPEATGDSLIERIEPRKHILSRMSKGRQQILVANVDQLVIVASAAEPNLKPNRSIASWWKPSGCGSSRSCASTKSTWSMRPI